MTVITMGGVGYREVHPLTQAGQIWTMFVIVSGVGALGFAVITVTDFMVEGHFSGILEGRRMDKRIAGLSGHNVVAGLGRVGRVVVAGGQRTELRMEEIALSAGDPYDGRTIGDTHIRSETGAYVLAIHGVDGSVNSNPDPATVMKEGDRLVVLGSDEQLLMLANRACADAGVCYAPIHRRPA